MPELTIDRLRAVMSANTRGGEIYPSVIRLVAAREEWSGRVSDVVLVLAEDQDAMRFIAGGDRPDEIADCVEQWAASSLDPDQIRLVFRCGGYDPEPFCTLADHGLLLDALLDEAGGLRRVHGERAGTWISDEFALATPEETVDSVVQMITESGSPETHAAE